MSIKEGDRLPSAKLQVMTDDGVQQRSTSDLFDGRKVVLFGVPGAFTPTCSARHLPGFVDRADELKQHGVDTIACLSVNDAFVMDAWGKQQNASDRVMMLADGNGDFVRKLGLDMDATGFGMGQRSKRFAMVVDDGVVTKLQVEAPGEFRVSSADAVLASFS